MYLPKHQYRKTTVEEIDGVFSLEIKKFPVGTAKDFLESLIFKLSGNPTEEVVVTSFGQVFAPIGIDFEKGDFSKAIELKVNTDNTSALEAENPKNKLKSFKLPPTSTQLKAGKMKRCFYRNGSTGQVKEIYHGIASNRANYLQRYEKIMCIDWEIKGPAKDQIVNGYFLEGIETRNKEKIEKLKNQMPGVEEIINGPSEYVVDTLPITSNNPSSPRVGFDIPSPGKSIKVSENSYTKFTQENISTKVKENLYAQPGEFLIQGTNKEYVGPYHLHPTKGPMVGAKHIDEPHSKLVPRDKSKQRIGVQNIQTEKIASQTGQPGNNQTSNNEQSYGGYVNPGSSPSPSPSPSASPSPSPSPSPSYSPPPSGGGGY